MSAHPRVSAVRVCDIARAKPRPRRVLLIASAAASVWPRATRGPRNRSMVNFRRSFGLLDEGHMSAASGLRHLYCERPKKVCRWNESGASDHEHVSLIGRRHQSQRCQCSPSPSRRRQALGLPGEVVGHGGAPLVPHHHCPDASSHGPRQHHAMWEGPGNGLAATGVARRSASQRLSALSSPARIKRMRAPICLAKGQRSG